MAIYAFQPCDAESKVLFFIRFFFNVIEFWKFYETKLENDRMYKNMIIKNRISLLVVILLVR